jgi:signal transduction histidine kinase
LVKSPERVEELGGTVDVESRVRKSSSVDVTIALPDWA